MALRRKSTEAAPTSQAKPARGRRSKSTKPEPPKPPTFEEAPTLTSDERYAEAAKPRTIRDHDEEW